MELQYPKPKKSKSIILLSFFQEYEDYLIKPNYCKTKNCINECYKKEEYCMQCIPIYIPGKYIKTPIGYKINGNKIVFIGYKLSEKKL